MTFRLSPLHIFLILLGVLLIGFLCYNTWESFQNCSKEGFADSAWSGTSVKVKKYGSEEGISVSNLVDTTHFDPDSRTLFEVSGNILYLTLSDATIKQQQANTSNVFDYFTSLKNDNPGNTIIAADYGNVITAVNSLKPIFNSISCTSGNCTISTSLQSSMYNLMGNASSSSGSILTILSKYNQTTPTTEIQKLFPSSETPTTNIILSEVSKNTIGNVLFHDTSFYNITKPSTKTNYVYQTKNGNYIFLVFPVNTTSVTFIHVIDRPSNKHFKSLYYMGNEMQMFTHSNKFVSTTSSDITSQTGGSQTNEFSGALKDVQYEGTSGLLKVMTSHDTTKQQVQVGLRYDTLAVRAFIQITSTGATIMKTEYSNDTTNTNIPTPSGNTNLSISLGNGMNFSIPSSFVMSYLTNSFFDSSTPDFHRDYLKKTQIVPPVCPSCPSCNSSTGVCTSCGGNGGSGTQTSQTTTSSTNATSANKSGEIAADLAKGFGSGVKDTVTGTVDLGKDAVGGTVGLAKDAVGSTVGLTKDAVGGTVGLAKDAVGGTVGLAKDAVSGIGSFLQNTGSGVGNFIQSSASGIGNYAKDAVSGVTNSDGQGQGGQGRQGGYQGSQGGYGQGQGMGQNGMGQNPGQDPYSYYGALPSKPVSNFMPVTADFSKFGR